MNRIRLAALTGVFCAILVGCSDPYAGRYAVSGKITVKGTPLKEASIQFEPMDGQDTRGGTGVTDGAYSIPRDAGLKPGKYVIRLTAGDGKTVETNNEDATSPGGTNIVSIDTIPPDYGASSKQQVEVKADGSNTFDLDLPYLLDPAKEAAKKKKKR